ncbi:MAG TPA: pyridoxamine 5-phosphate oxidase, partial [Clostridia bacterium]|nr:pyridoxamine 5-phosphate oxidase [Clostridia bacterium]
QLRANPHFEISATSADGSKWLRLRGQAVFITSQETKKAALEHMPSLRRMYSEDDDIFEIFYADQAEATFADLEGNIRTFKL